MKSKFFWVVFALYLPFNSFAQESKWEFRFFNSYGTVDRSPIQKNSLDRPDNFRSLYDVIENAASMNQTDRSHYISEQCQGMNMRDKVEMARHLSELAGDVYDYNRIGTGENKYDIVTPEEQWDAIASLLDPNRSTENVGVCRDMTLTVSRFLLDCGVPKDCLSIHSYRSETGGHQVVQAGCGDEMYTINWSELYTTDSYDYTNMDLMPNIRNTGIKHRVYDPETGEMIDVRQTELGHILNVVTDGELDDPFYKPELLMLEAQYSVMTLGVFKARMRNGEELGGIKAILESRPSKYLHISAGIAYADKAAQGNGIYPGLDQEILFANFKGDIFAPQITLINRGKTKIVLNNEIGVRLNGAIYRNKIQGIEDHFSNIDGTSFVHHRSQIAITRENLTATAGIRQRYGFDILNHSQVAAPTGIYSRNNRGVGFYNNERTFLGGISYGLPSNQEVSSQVSFSDRPQSKSRRVTFAFRDNTSGVAALLSQTRYQLDTGPTFYSYDANLNRDINTGYGNLNIGVEAKYTPDMQQKYYGGLNLRFTPGN